MAESRYSSGVACVGSGAHRRSGPWAARRQGGAVLAGEGAWRLTDGERELLREGLVKLGGSWGREAAATAPAMRALELHLRWVVEGNRRQNLTAITVPREMVVKHTVDSATVLGAVEVRPGARILDVGSGAGFPGVVVQILVPVARVTLLDSNQKKCEFLDKIREGLVAAGIPGAAGLEVVWGRAEEKGRDKEMREQFDVVVSRAVAELCVLVELMLPFCRVGGYAVALKGPGVEEELMRASVAIGVLGGAVERLIWVELPERGGTRAIVVVRKVSPTPPAYPRRAGIPAKRPIGKG